MRYDATTCAIVVLSTMLFCGCDSQNTPEDDLAIAKAHLTTPVWRAVQVYSEPPDSSLTLPDRTVAYLENGIGLFFSAARIDTFHWSMGKTSGKLLLSTTNSDGIHFVDTVATLTERELHLIRATRRGTRHTIYEPSP